MNLRNALVKELQDIINDILHVEDKSGINLSIIINNIKIKGKIMAVQLTDTQKTTGFLEFSDVKGAPAQVQAGTAVITSSNTDVVAVVINPTNELGFDLVAGIPGTAQVDYSVDADPGDGVVTLSGFTAVEVQASMAVGFKVNFSEPVEQ